MLTMYIIPCDDKEASDFENAEESISEIADEVIQLSDHNLTNIEKRSDSWFGYIYSNERFDYNLYQAIPYYLKAESRFDYLVLYKKVMHEGELKIFRSPRIFRSEVIIEEGTLIPREPNLHSPVVALDGWILEGNDVYL